MRYFFAALGVLILLAASVAIVVRSFQVGTASEVRTEQAQPRQEKAVSESDERSEDRIPVAAQAPALPEPAGATATRRQAALPGTPATGRMPFQDRLDLTAAQVERVRHILLTHNIMQLEETDFPLRVGAKLPADVQLTPLPIELAELVPDFPYYSYVISRNQIAIVVTERREIKLLIPFPAPA